MERIHVSIRARPLSQDDAKTSPWRVCNNAISTLNNSPVFEFDHIFGEDGKTMDVYKVRTKEIVAAAVRGFNGTVFAYGQTNSGKTHTMRGTLYEPGVIPLAVHDVFSNIREDIYREFLLRMSYMEIYNEEINDLLDPEHRKLQIHESLDRGIYVAGLREEIVASPEQVLQLMEFGESHRHIGETNMNLYSSRSHTIFRMIIESRDRTDISENVSSCDSVRVSVLNLVDLAGSERAAKTGAEGVRLKEGSHINKSLMTLGSVIKKLSESAETQGGHIPYRDSKLTRILQPALGGNANTAIICNITLAQIHFDETKSSLQFASRALHVTNCAQVNEILTDAALLKRQKKEIEELRAKLMGSHSEHFEEEILNLRNTLLKTELERERIAFELDIEKKSQAERERKLQDQANKIKNLSSMVLNSCKYGAYSCHKTDKRRQTWASSNNWLNNDNYMELTLTGAKAVGDDCLLTKSRREIGPLLCFEDLLNEPENFVHNSMKQDSGSCSINPVDDCRLPDPTALLHVTSRKKVSARSKCHLETDDSENWKSFYEDLFLQYESQRTCTALEIDFLKRKLAEIEYSQIVSNDDDITTNYNNKSSSSKDTTLEIIDEHHDKECDLQFVAKVSAEIEDIQLQVRDLNLPFSNTCYLLEELLQSYHIMLGFMQESKTLTFQNSVQLKSFICDHVKLQNLMAEKISQLDSEKLLFKNKSDDLSRVVDQHKLDALNFNRNLAELYVEHTSEKSYLNSQIQMMEKEILFLSSGSIVKEKEILRKDYDKIKSKLTETEFKLKNAIQEKTKLKSEKACVERELKQLRGQNVLLERDMNKRESLGDRRRDSIFERNTPRRDPMMWKGHKGICEENVEDNKSIEVICFEMEATIASLEGELALACQAKEEALSVNEILESKLEALSEDLDASLSQVDEFQEEMPKLKTKIEESEANTKQMQHSINLLEDEKEKLAMQLTDALLELEEEKAIWSAKEKVSVDAIEMKSKSFHAKLTSLYEELTDMKNELESCRQKCVILEITSASLEEKEASQIKSRMERDFEIGKLRGDLLASDLRLKESEEGFKEEVLRVEKEKEELRCVTAVKVEERRLQGEEWAKVRMRLHWTQAKLDGLRLRNRECLDELDNMRLKYEKSVRQLKQKLATSCHDILDLKKQLAQAKTAL